MSTIGFIADSQQEMYSRYLFGTKYILEADVDLISSGRSQRDAILATDKPKAEQAAEHSLFLLDDAAEWMDKFDSTTISADTKAIVKNAHSELADARKARQIVLAHAVNGRDAEALAAAPAVSAITAKLDALIQNLVDSRATKAGEAAAQSEAASASARTITIALIGVALALGLGVGFWLSRNISNRTSSILNRLQSLRGHCLADLRASMVALVGGDLTSGVTPVTSKIPASNSDELGQAIEETNQPLRHLPHRAAGRPPEHTLNGKPFAFETHFVHKNAKGELAVVGVLHNIGAKNPTLAPI